MYDASWFESMRLCSTAGTQHAVRGLYPRTGRTSTDQHDGGMCNGHGKGQPEPPKPPVSCVGGDAMAVDGLPHDCVCCVGRSRLRLDWRLANHVTERAARSIDSLDSSLHVDTSGLVAQPNKRVTLCLNHFQEDVAWALRLLEEPPWPGVVLDIIIYDCGVSPLPEALITHERVTVRDKFGKLARVPFFYGVFDHCSRACEESSGPSEYTLFLHGHERAWHQKKSVAELN